MTLFSFSLLKSHHIKYHNSLSKDWLDLYSTSSIQTLWIGLSINTTFSSLEHVWTRILLHHYVILERSGSLQNSSVTCSAGWPFAEYKIRFCFLGDRWNQSGTALNESSEPETCLQSLSFFESNTKSVRKVYFLYWFAQTYHSKLRIQRLDDENITQNDDA